jgi:hypothetical protein
MPFQCLCPNKIFGYIVKVQVKCGPTAASKAGVVGARHTKSAAVHQTGRNNDWSIVQM